ncbi:MAG: hypothetical protein ABFD66_05355, partial [Smithella sp.]
FTTASPMILDAEITPYFSVVFPFLLSSVIPSPYNLSLIVIEFYWYLWPLFMLADISPFSPAGLNYALRKEKRSKINKL